MRKGDRVKLVDTKGLDGYQIMKQLKKGKIYTIERIKPSGGLILEEIEHPENLFGEVQGIMKDRFKIVKKRAVSPILNKRKARTNERRKKRRQIDS